MSGPFRNQGVCVQEYLYDYSVDGGSVGAIVLSDKSGVDPLPAGAIVKAVSMHVITAFGSGGAATLSWGNGDSATAYSGTAIAVASLTLDSVFNGMGNGSSSLWNDSEDAPKLVYIDESTTTGKFQINIGSVAMNAGKAVFLVEYLLPKAQS